MHTIGMTMHQVQVNTKFLNALPSEWSKFVTDVKNQATIQDGRVTVQKVQGRQNQSYVDTGNKGIATTSKGNFAAGQPRVEKLMLDEAQEAGQILDEEKLAFLADPDMDAYDSGGDDLSSAKAVLMENLSSCDPEVLSEVPYSDSYPGCARDAVF
ncbi:hypothetical protein Tco_0276276 [Tanacetum coccineum]